MAKKPKKQKKPQHHRQNEKKQLQTWKEYLCMSQRPNSPNVKSSNKALFDFVKKSQKKL